MKEYTIDRYISMKSDIWLIFFFLSYLNVSVNKFHYLYKNFNYSEDENKNWFRIIFWA